MWISKIGNKSASFINHKFFHPGNLKNLERVWLAEEKEKKRKQEEEEYLKKREEQLRMQNLKKILRKNEEEMNRKSIFHNNDFTEINKKQNNNKGSELESKKNCDSEEIETNKKKPIIKSKYKEHVYLNNHTSVYGSYYDMETKSWGFKCCNNTDKNSICSKNKNSKWVQTRNCTEQISENKKNVKKDLKKKKKKKKHLIIDNSITAVLNHLN